LITVLDSESAGSARHAAQRRTTGGAGVAPATHLGPLLAAVLLVVAVMTTGVAAAERIEAAVAPALAPLLLAQARQGLALQRAAAHRSDLLLVYGSSELMNTADPYHANHLLTSESAGFTPFIVANQAATLLNLQQAAAALGPDLRNRRVAISVTQGSFLYNGRPEPGYYPGSFSRLHAYRLVFDAPLSDDLRRAATRRMLAYPVTLRNDPVLRGGARLLAEDSPLGRLGYLVLLPLGKLGALVLELQDHWEVVLAADAGRMAAPAAAAPHPAAGLDWPALALAAEADYRARSASNPYGFADELWAAQDPDVAPPRGTTPERIGRELVDSAGWEDLELLLRTLRELGAEPVVLSVPLHGAYYDDYGVAADARRAYYERLRAAAARHGVAVVDFADFDRDRFFLRDRVGHLSSKGWVYYAEALEAVHHGRLR
jgi:D-alanine transfer protein